MELGTLWEQFWEQWWKVEQDCSISVLRERVFDCLTVVCATNGHFSSTGFESPDIAVRNYQFSPGIWSASGIWPKWNQ